MAKDCIRNVLLTACAAAAATVLALQSNEGSAAPPERQDGRNAIAALGARLFADARLSRDGTMSCASCHDPARAFTNPRPPVRPGVIDERLRRDVPSLLNVTFFVPLHHDGREPSLEVQILAPLFNKAEMANTTFDDLKDRLAAIPEYREDFEKVFRERPTIENIGKAIAAYERSLIADDSAFDRWRLAEARGVHTEANGAHADANGARIVPDPYRLPNMISAEAQAGAALFAGKAGCTECHPIGRLEPILFTANTFLNTGIGFQSETRRVAEHPEAPADRGREEVTHNREDRFKFRTPTLRNVELTAPYMHDGSIKTLEDVIAYYDKGGSPDPEKDPRIKPLGLTDTERQALLDFLKCLTSIERPGAAPVGKAPKP